MDRSIKKLLYETLQKRMSTDMTEDIIQTRTKIKKESQDHEDDSESQQPGDTVLSTLTINNHDNREPSSSSSPAGIEKSSSSTVTPEDAGSLMVTQIKCEPSSEDNECLPAIQHCTHREDGLCKECMEYHARLKSLKSQAIKKYCKTHPNTLLEFYCTNHNKPCCMSCISVNHRGCCIITLDQASKNVKNSALFTNTIEHLNHLTETVHLIFENRGVNLKALEKIVSVVRQQIGNVKSRLLKEIDDVEKSLIAQLSLIKKKNETKIINQRIAFLNLKSRLAQNKEELDILKEHGSDMHLYLALRKFVKDNRKIETAIQDLSSSFEDVCIKFHEANLNDIQLMGSIQENSKQGIVQYSPVKSPHTQIKEEVKSLTYFQKNEDLRLRPGERYWIADIAVSSDNQLLMTNWHSSHPKVYSYRDCEDYEGEIHCPGSPYGITVIPDKNTAVVTLPKEESIQFINTTSLSNGDKVNVGVKCWGITATRGKIIIGSYGVVHILDGNGSTIRKVGENNINTIIYDKVNDLLLCGYYCGMCCVTLDFKSVYQLPVSGRAGITVDQEGRVYLNYVLNEIHRLSSAGKFQDVVLNRDHGINNVYALSFNNDYTKLFVVNNNKSVSVFSCN